LRDGMQVADAIASSTFAAFEPNRFGNVEPRYVTELLRIAYRGKSKKLLGYGMKILPSEKVDILNKGGHYDWLHM